MDRPTFIPIMRITVTDLLESSWDNEQRGWFIKRRSYEGLARVDRVIRGAIEARLIKIIAPESSCDSPFAVGEGIVARVEKVLKGQIDGAEIKIVANLSTCGLGFAIGERGIVVGALRRDARGSLELIAVEETPEDRDKRRASKANR